MLELVNQLTVTDLSFIGMDHYLIKGPPQSIPVLVSIVTSHDEMIQMCPGIHKEDSRRGWGISEDFPGNYIRFTLQ